MLNKKARKLIGYNDFVKQIASAIKPEDLDYLVTDNLSEMLHSHISKSLYFDHWEFADKYRFIGDVKREQRKVLHSSITPEVIFKSLPFATQAAAQEAVLILTKAVSKSNLYKLNSGVEVAKNILWRLFYCTGADILKTSELCHEMNFPYSYNELSRENKLLYDFIVVLYNVQWLRNGEVTRLRTADLI